MLRLRTFGCLVIDGSPRSLGGSATQRQALALLALVAAAGGRGLSRDKIITMLWPEADARRAAHRLSQLLHAIRRDLKSPALFAESGELRLNSELMTSDVSDFKSAYALGELNRAVSYYCGPFLDGFFLSGAVQFEQWVESERAWLARSYGEALEGLGMEAEVRGDQSGAAAWWTRLAEHEPLSSRVIMRLMSALAAHGDRAGALRQAERYTVGVGRELEASPNPAVLALAASLRRTPAGASPSSTASSSRFSIAVQPITNLSTEPDNDYLAEGLVEELTNRLARLEGVRLMSVSSPESTTRPSLDAVLEGSIRQADRRIRLILRLIDPADGAHMWSQCYERTVENVFQLQDELTDAVVAELRTVLSR